MLTYRNIMRLIVLVGFLIYSLFQIRINPSKDCKFEFNGKTYSCFRNARPITKSECNELKDKLGIEHCPTDTDYWAGAVKECGGVDKMASTPEVFDIYKSTKIDYNKFDRDKVKQYGLSNVKYVWTSWEGFGGCANKKKFIRACVYNMGNKKGAEKECAGSFKFLKGPEKRGDELHYKIQSNGCVEYPTKSEAIHVKSVAPAMIGSARNRLERSYMGATFICRIK